MSLDTCNSTIPGVPGYRILRRLGEGGMGEVFLAQNQGNCQQVALKILKPGTELQAFEAADRFQREVSVLSRLSHPGIVRVLDSGCLDDRPYIVMDYVSGGSLRQLLNDQHRLSCEHVQWILTELASALVYLHQQGIVHRDLKPENVLVSELGEIRLTDFGIAVSVKQVGELTRSGQILGTLDYMAPEQRHRLSLDHRADQFSLAVMTYEMLTGRKPLGNFKPASLWNARLTSQVDAVLMRALAEDPDDRFDCLSDFANQLNVALSRPRHSVARRLAVAAVVLVSLASVVLLAHSTRRHDDAPPSTADPRVTELSGETANVDPRIDQVAYYRSLAARHVEQGDLDRAVHCLTQALTIAPDQLDLLMERAHALWKARLHADALLDLERIVAINPAHPQAYTQTGLIHMQAGDLSRARQALDQAIAQSNLDATAFAYLGRVEYLGNDLSAAEGHFNHALELDSECGEAYHFRGLLRQKRRDFQGAISDYEQWVRCTPDNPFAYAFLASLLATCSERPLRDGERALILGRRACELSGWSDAQCLRSLAAAHAALEQWPEAVRWCQEAFHKAPLADRESLQRQLDYYRKKG